MEKKEETGNLLSMTKERYGCFPIPTPHVQSSCFQDSETDDTLIINVVNKEIKKMSEVRAPKGFVFLMKRC